MGRTERTGPISAGSVEWYTATKRVMPPSTTSSHTTSAALTPVCGRASIEFSILAASAGWAGTAPLSSPVSGHSTGAGGGGGGGGGGVVEVAATVGVPAAAGV